MICGKKDTRLPLQHCSGEMRWVYPTKLPTNGDGLDVGIGINSPMPFDSCLHLVLCSDFGQQPSSLQRSERPI